MVILGLYISPTYSQDITAIKKPDENPAFDENSINKDYIAVPIYNKSEFTFTTGYDYSSGKFNLPANTNISYIPYSLKYSTESWSFKASSGYISFAAPKNVITAVEGAPLVTDVMLTGTDRFVSSRKRWFW